MPAISNGDASTVNRPASARTGVRLIGEIPAAGKAAVTLTSGGSTVSPASDRTVRVRTAEPARAGSATTSTRTSFGSSTEAVTGPAVDDDPEPERAWFAIP